MKVCLKKQASLVLAVMMLLTSLLSTASRHPVTAEASDAYYVDLLREEWIAEGAQNVTVNEDGTWTVSGPFALAPYLTLDYTVYSEMRVSFESMGGGVAITMLDRDPNGVYEDHWINLSNEWFGEPIFAQGITEYVGSIVGIYRWCIQNIGWTNPDNLFTVRAIYVEPEVGTEIVFTDLGLIDPSTPPVEVLVGDMSGDGVLNTMDALLLFGGINGARELTAEQRALADFTGDGSVNMMDALRLFKFVSGQ